jgi:hypothetical protein
MISIEGYIPIGEYCKREYLSLSLARKLIKNKKLKHKKIKRLIYVWIG